MYSSQLLKGDIFFFSAIECCWTDSFLCLPSRLSESTEKPKQNCPIPQWIWMKTVTRIKNFSKRRHCGTSRVSRDSHTVARLSVYAESWSFISPTRGSWTFLTSGGLVMSKLGFRFALYLFHMRNHRFTNKMCRTFQTGGKKVTTENVPSSNSLVKMLQMFAQIRTDFT